MRTCVLSVMHYCIAKSGQRFECNFKRFKAEIEERKLFLEYHQNIFIFSVYTAANLQTIQKVHFITISYSFPVSFSTPSL